MYTEISCSEIIMIVHSLFLQIKKTVLAEIYQNSVTQMSIL